VKFSRYNADFGLNNNATGCWLFLVLFLNFGPTAFAGERDGTLVLTIDYPTVSGAFEYYYDHFQLEIQRQDHSERKTICYSHTWLTFYSCESKSDFSKAGEEGAVQVLELSAGEWEVRSFRVMAGQMTFWPKNDFSIPFTIRPERATYIGDFHPIGCLYKGPLLGVTMAGPVRLLITDKSARDIPIAQSKKADLGPIDVSVFDVDTLGNPWLTGHDNPVVAAQFEATCPHEWQKQGQL